ncbi:unnamed protein product, partial [Discosporangium mesarthrocarpum]
HGGSPAAGVGGSRRKNGNRSKNVTSLGTSALARSEDGGEDHSVSTFTPTCFSGVHSANFSHRNTRSSLSVSFDAVARAILHAGAGKEVLVVVAKARQSALMREREEALRGGGGEGVQLRMNELGMLAEVYSEVPGAECRGSGT